MAKWLALIVLLGCTGVVGWQGLGHLGDFTGRLAHLESRALRGSARNALLEAEIEELTVRLETVGNELEVRTEKVNQLTELAGRLGFAEDQLGEISNAIVMQEQTLDSLLTDRQELDPEVVEAHFATLDQELRSRWQDALVLASSAAEMAGESRQRVERITREIEMRSDHETMWRELVAPVVQLAGEDSVGSGILLESVETESGYLTHLITAWHVVRDIQRDLEHTDMPVPVEIYLRDGSTVRETATLIAFDAAIDVALLELDTDRWVPYGARMASRRKVRNASVFDEIYAVGCPLGNAPIPTQGEISAGHHYVDGEVYIMINAPTYVGNSGGGIFSSDDRELLGVFSKVYTHGAVRPTIVTHMGLITPMDTVYDWFHSIGYGELEPAGE